MEGLVPSLHLGVSALGWTESGYPQGQDDQPKVRSSPFPRSELLTGRETAPFLAATVLILYSVWRYRPFGRVRQFCDL